MGTETSLLNSDTCLTTSFDVKLNNPLMGTETIGSTNLPIKSTMKGG